MSAYVVSYPIRCVISVTQYALGDVSVREAGMPVIVRRDGSDIIVPAGIPEFVIDGIGMIILQGPRYATSYLYRREFGIDTKAERKVAVVKITWPYIAAPNSIDMMNSALVAAGINPDDMLRQIRMMH